MLSGIADIDTLTASAPAVSVTSGQLDKEADVHSPARLSLWLSLAVVSAVVAAVTLVAPHWLETYFGLDPDGGNGSVEWLIVILAAAMSTVAWWRVAMGLRAAR